MAFSGEWNQICCNQEGAILRKLVSLEIEVISNNLKFVIGAVQYASITMMKSNSWQFQIRSIAIIFNFYPFALQKGCSNMCISFPWMASLRSTFRNSFSNCNFSLATVECCDPLALWLFRGAAENKATRCHMFVMTF